jgi:hypothetical protein
VSLTNFGIRSDFHRQDAHRALTEISEENKGLQNQVKSLEQKVVPLETENAELKSAIEELAKNYVKEADSALPAGGGETTRLEPGQYNDISVSRVSYRLILKSITEGSIGGDTAQFRLYRIE